VLADVAASGLPHRFQSQPHFVITSYPDAMAHGLCSKLSARVRRAMTMALFPRPASTVPRRNLAGNTLWLADTENHLIAGDLDKKPSPRRCGTGKQAFDPEAGKSGTKQG